MLIKPFLKNGFCWSRASALLSLLAVALLVLSRGGKVSLGAHASWALIFLSGCLLPGRFWVRFCGHAVFPLVLGLAFWQGVSVLLSQSPLPSLGTFLSFWAPMVLFVVGRSVWGVAQKEGVLIFFSCVVVFQFFLLMNTSFLLFPGNPQYMAFWSLAVFFLLFPIWEKGKIVGGGEGRASVVLEPRFFRFVIPAKAGIQPCTRQTNCREKGKTSLVSLRFVIPAKAGIHWFLMLLIEPGFCNRREDRDEGGRGSFDEKSAGPAGCMDKLFEEENVRPPSSNPAGYCKIRVEARWKLLLGAVAVCALGNLLVLPVRAGLLGLGGGLLAFMGARFGKRGFVWTGVALMAVLVFLPMDFLHQKIKFSDPQSFKRVDLWRTALKGISQRPLFGWGPGQFETLYRAHALPQENQPVRYEMETSFAHNESLQLMADSGVPSFLFLLVLLWVFFKNRPPGSLSPRFWGIGTALFLFSCVNFPMALPADGVLVACLAVFLKRIPLPFLRLVIPAKAGIHRFLTEPRGNTVRVIKSFLFLFFIVQSALAMNEFSGKNRSLVLDTMDPRALERRISRVTEDFQRGNKTVAAQALAGLRRWSPHRGEVWRLSSLTTENRNDARVFFKQALSLHPYHAPWWAEMAFFQKDPESARFCLKKSLELEPRYFHASLAYGVLLRDEGRSTEACVWLKRLKNQSRFWPKAAVTDSGYRREILSRDDGALDSLLSLCESP